MNLFACALAAVRGHGVPLGSESRIGKALRILHCRRRKAVAKRAEEFDASAQFTRAIRTGAADTALGQRLEQLWRKPWRQIVTRGPFTSESVLNTEHKPQYLRLAFATRCPLP